MDLRTVRKRCATTLRTVGVGYAALAVLFAAGLPYAALLVRVRRGRFEDRHGPNEIRQLELERFGTEDRLGFNGHGGDQWERFSESL